MQPNDFVSVRVFRDNIIAGRQGQTASQAVRLNINITFHQNRIDYANIKTQLENTELLCSAVGLLMLCAFIVERPHILLIKSKK